MGRGGQHKDWISGEDKFSVTERGTKAAICGGIFYVAHSFTIVIPTKPLFFCHHSNYFVFPLQNSKQKMITIQQVQFPLSSSCPVDLVNFQTVRIGKPGRHVCEGRRWRLRPLA